MVLGGLIKRERLAAGLTQTQLGERLGVKKAVVSHWEAGRQRPSRVNVQKLGEVLGIDPGVILELSTNSDSARAWFGWLDGTPSTTAPRPLRTMAMVSRKTDESQAASTLTKMAGMLTDPRALEILQLFSSLEDHQRENLLYVCRVAAKIAREGHAGGEPVRSGEPLPA